MSKRESPLEEFPGHVVLPDFLNVLQVRTFEDAFFGDPNEIRPKGKKIYLSVDDAKMIPVILDTVSEWHLEGIPEKPTVETLPMTPREVGHKLVSWLSGELYKLYTGEKQVPNA